MRWNRKNSLPLHRKNARISFSGFTLVELLVASGLIVAFMTAVYGTFITASQWMQPQNNQAYCLARNKMEELFEAVRYDWWPAASRPLTVGGPYSESALVVDNTTYTRTYSVAAVAVGTRDYRKVTVDVTW